MLHTVEPAGDLPMTIAEWADMDEDEPGELRLRSYGVGFGAIWVR
ncbi:MAG: hypothetical protein U0441_27490 [Polyangiaceae bacterium]